MYVIDLCVACHLFNDFNFVPVPYLNENMIKKYQPDTPENQLVNRVNILGPPIWHMQQLALLV